MWDSIRDGWNGFWNTVNPVDCDSYDRPEPEWYEQKPDWRSAVSPRPVQPSRKPVKVPLTGEQRPKSHRLPK